MGEIESLLQSQWVAGALCTFLFVWIGAILFTLYYILRFSHTKDASEQKFLRYLMVGFVVIVSTLILTISTAVSLDGLRWFYWQWGTGLIMACLLAIAVVALGFSLAKIKGDLMRWLP